MPAMDTVLAWWLPWPTLPPRGVWVPPCATPPPSRTATRPQSPGPGRTPTLLLLDTTPRLLLLAS